VSKGRQLTGEIEGDQDILSRDECLQILSEMAQKGSVSAAIALERLHGHRQEARRGALAKRRHPQGDEARQGHPPWH
jgi:hypothetical protein